MGFEATLALVSKAYNGMRCRGFYAKWMRKLDGTPVPNDLCVAIATSVAERERELEAELAEAKRLMQDEQDKVFELQSSGGQMGHVILEHSSFPASVGCQCEDCREVAKRMADAGYCDRIKDRWWEPPESEGE